MPTTVLDPVTNLPENKNKNIPGYTPLTAADYKAAFKYGSAGDTGFIGTATKGPDQDKFDFQLKPNIDNYELRAQRQSTTDQIGNAVVNLVGGTAFKFLQGVGYAGGGVKALLTGDINEMLSNSFTAAFETAEEVTKEKFPIYKTKKYLEGNIWEQMSTPEFWFDDVIDGVSFLASAWASGGIYGALSKGVGTYSKLAKYYNAAIRGNKLLKFAPKAGADALKFTKALDFTTITAYNTVTEAAFEAKDVRDLYLDGHADELAKGGPDADRIEKEAKSAALNTFLWNAAILTPSNALELTFMFKKFSMFGKANKNIINPITGKIASPIKNSFSDYVKTFVKRGAITSATEGGYEENLQFAVQRFNTERDTNFNFDVPYSEQIKTVLSNAVTNFKDDEGLKNIMLGAIIGFLPGGIGGVNSKVEEQKIHNAKIAMAGDVISAMEGVSNRYLKMDPILDEKGKPTGKFKPSKTKEGGALFDKEKVSRALLEDILKYNNFFSLAKALNSRNPLLAEYATYKDVANNILKLVSSGLTKEDAKNSIEVAYKAELESLEKEFGEISEEDKKDLREIYEGYSQAAGRYADIYKSISTKHAGTFDFGKTKEGIHRRNALMAMQYSEAVYQDFWSTKKKDIIKQLSNVKSDTLVELLDSLDKELSEGALLNTSYSYNVNKITSLEQQVTRLKAKEEKVTGKIKEGVTKELEDVLNKLEASRSNLNSVEERYNKEEAFRKTKHKQTIADKINALETEIEELKNAQELEEVEPLIKEQLKGKEEAAIKEKSILEKRIEALDKTTLELRELIRSGNPSKEDSRVFTNELKLRSKISDILDSEGTESKTLKDEMVDLLEKTFEIDDILYQSFLAMKDLLSEKKQKALWEKEKELTKNPITEEEGPVPEPSITKNTSEDAVATVIGTDGKVKILTNLTEEDAVKYGYKVHVGQSTAAAKTRGEDITKGKITPSVYFKVDKQNGRRHFIYTDGTAEGNIIREVDYLTRRILKEGDKKVNDAVTYVFNNNSLLEIRYTKGGEFNTLPKASNPTNSDGEEYTKDTFEELFRRLSDYLPGYSVADKNYLQTVPTVTPQDTAKVLEELKKTKADKLIKEYWGTDIYDASTPKALFTEGSYTEMQVFYNDIYGILHKKDKQLVFTPFEAGEGDSIVTNIELEKVVTSINSESSFKELGITVAKDTYLELNISKDGKVITIEGEDFTNEFYNPTEAIIEDSEGNPIAVKLVNEGGKEVTFKDKHLVEAVSYSILLSEFIYDQAFDTLFLDANKESPIIITVQGKEYGIYRKEGNLIVWDIQVGKEVATGEGVYKGIVDRIKNALSKTVNDLIAKEDFDFNKNVKEKRNEVRRINEILGSKNPEAAYRAATKSEVQITKGVEKAEAEDLTSIPEDEIRAVVEDIKESIKVKNDIIKGLREESAKARKGLLEDPGTKLAETNKELIGLTKQLQEYEEREADNISVRSRIDNEIEKVKNKIAVTKKGLAKNESILKRSSKKETKEKYIEIIQRGAQKVTELEGVKKQLEVNKDSLSSLSQKEVKEKYNRLEVLKEEVKDLKGAVLRDDWASSLEGAIRKAEAWVQVRKVEIANLYKRLEPYENVLKDKVGKRLAKEKKVSQVADSTTKEGRTTSFIEIGGDVAEATDPSDLEDGGYIEIVTNNSGIIHSATAVSYVTNTGKKFITRNETLEDHAVLEGVDYDTVVPYIKLQKESEEDNVVDWWVDNGLEKIYKKLISEEALSEEDINTLTSSTSDIKFEDIVDNLPIGLIYKNNKGETVAQGNLSYHASNFPVYIPSSIRDLIDTDFAAYKKALFEYTTKIALQTRKSRVLIIRTILGGGKIEFPVDKVGKGTPNNVGKNQPLAQLLDKLGIDLKNASLGVAIKRGLIKFGKEELAVAFGSQGNVFWRTYNTVNGEPAILKLNPAKLSAEHAALVLKILQDGVRAGGGKFKQVYENDKESKFPLSLPKVEGNLTREQILKLLIKHGKKSTKIGEGETNSRHLLEKQLYIDNIKGTLTLVFGQNRIPLFSQNKEDLDTFVAWATTNKNYNISKYNLDEALTYGDFKIGDLEYNSNEDNYNSFILKGGLLLTDVDTYKTSKIVFRQPAIIIDTAAAGIDLTLSKSQEEALNIVKGRIIIGAKEASKKEPKPTASVTTPKDTSIDNAKKEFEVQRTTPVNKASLNETFTTLKGSPVGTKVFIRDTQKDDVDENSDASYRILAEVVEKEGKRELVFTPDPKLLKAAIIRNIIEDFKKSKIDLEAGTEELHPGVKPVMWTLYYDAPSNKGSDFVIGDEQDALTAEIAKDFRREQASLVKEQDDVEKAVAKEFKEEASIKHLEQGERTFTKEGFENVSKEDLKALDFDDEGDIFNSDEENEWFRTTDNSRGDYEVGDYTGAVKWLRERVGDDIAIRMHRGLIKARGGKTAFGKILESGILLSDRLAVGTEYHEAFHIVSLYYLSSVERASMYKEALRKYKSLKNKSNKEIEEFLAERFREFILEKNSGKRIGIIKRIGKVLAEIFNFIYKTLTFTKTLETFDIAQLFNRIDKGHFKASTILKENKNTLSVNEEEYLRETGFNVNGVELTHIKDDEQFYSIVKGLTNILIRESGLMTKDAKGKLTLQLNDFEDLSKINYTSLFKYLSKTGGRAFKAASALKQKQALLKKYSSNKDVFEAVKKQVRIEVDLDKLEDALQNRINKEIKKALLFNEILTNKDIFLDQIEDWLSEIGVSTNRANLGELLEESDVYDTTVEDISQMATYNDVVFKHSQKDNTASLIKLILSILPEDNVVDPLTGFITPIPFGVMWERVMSDFQHVSKTEDIMARLATLSEGDAAYTVLYRHLKGNERLKTQFSRTIRKSQIDFINALVDVSSGGVGMRFMSASVQTLSDTYINNWSRQMVYASNLFHKGELVKDSLDKYSDAFDSIIKTASAAYGKGSLASEIGIHKEKVISLLNTIGIKFNEKQLDAVMRELDTSPDKALMSLLLGKGTFKGLYYILDKDNGTIAGITKVLQNKKITIENFLKNESGLRWFADAIARNSPTELGYSVFGPKGNRYYSIMANTYMTDTLNSYKELLGDTSVSSDLIQERLNTAYGASSDILNLLNTNAEFKKNFNVKTLSAVVVEDSGDTGREYQELSDVEDFLLRLNVNLKGNREGTVSGLMVPTPADMKSVQIIEGLNKLEVYLDKDGNIPIAVLDKFANYARSEHGRVELTKFQIEEAIKGVFPYDNLIENIHYKTVSKGYKVKKGDVVLLRGKGGKTEIAKVGEFIENSGKYVKDSKGYISRGSEYTHYKSFNESTILEDINKYLLDALQNEIKVADSYGIVAAQEIEGEQAIIRNLLIDESLIEDVLKKTSLSKEDAVKNVLLDNMVNTMYISAEMEKAFYGDPAAFKNADDVMKRVHQYYSTGDNLRNDFPADFDNNSLVTKGTYNTSVSNDVVFESEYNQVFIDMFTETYLATGVFESEEEARKAATEKLNAFKEVNETDGQSFILPEMFRALAIKLGDWGDNRQEAYEKLMSTDPLTTEEKATYLNTVMQPLKMQYLKVNSKNSQMYTILDKMSLATLFPALVKDTKLQELYDRMSAQGKYEGSKKIHQFKYKSAQKTGVSTVSDFWEDEKRTKITDLSNLLIEEQDFNYLKHQLITTPHEQQDYQVGTQVIKSGIADVALDVEYKESGRLGADIVKEIHTILNKMSDYGKNELMQDMGVDSNYTITDKGSFIGRIKKEAVKAGLPFYIINSFKLDERGKFFMQLDAFPGNRRWIQSRVLSLIKKAAADLRMPGGVYYQVSSIGIEGYETDDKLKVFREDGLIEAKVSIRMFKDVIPGYNKLSHEGKVKWLDEHPKAAVIAYRIPTQGLNSEFGLLVKGYLREEAGNVIILPAEGTTIGGFDFDIDKLYLMRHNYDRHGLKIEYSTEVSEDASKQRYIQWVNEQAPKEIKHIIRSLLKSEAEAIRDKYSDRISLIKEILNEEKGSKNLQLYKGLQENVDKLGEEFKDTTEGKLLTDNFQVIKRLVRTLSTDIENEFISLNDKLNHAGKTGAEKALKFKDLADLIIQEGVDTQDMYALSSMITLYNQQLNLFGYKDEFLKERESALREEFTRSKNIINEESYAERLLQIQEQVDSKNKEYFNARFSEAGEIAENSEIMPFNIFKDTSLLHQNTKKALQNRLLDNYLEIYLDEKHRIFKYQPLEYGTRQMSAMADVIATANESVKDFVNKPMWLMSSAYQTMVKYKYGLGKNLGVVALSGSHHSLGQSVGLGLFDNIGIGNTTIYKGKTVTDLSQVYSKRERGIKVTETKEGVKTSKGNYLKIPITELHSSLVNAFVDLPTNSYAAHLNLTERNLDVVLLLIRAGVGFNTFWYSAQPILKELTEKEKNIGNKIGIKVGTPLEELIQKYSYLVSPEFNVAEEEKNIHKNMKDIFDPEALRWDITMPKEIRNEAYYERQLKVLLAYKSLQPYAESLKEVVLSSRDDTKKQGSTHSQLLIYNLRKQKALDIEEVSAKNALEEEYGNKGIRNFSSLMSSTLLKSISTNITTLDKGILEQLMLEATGPFEGAVIHLLESIGKRFTANPKVVDNVASEMYTNIIADFFKSKALISENNYKDLVVNKNNIVRKIAKISNGSYLPGLKKNRLLKAMIPVIRKEGYDNLIFIKPESKGAKDALNRSWASMFNSENIEEANFAIDLFYYSYLTSGFKNNMFSFFDLTPIDILKYLGYDTFMENKLSELRTSAASMGNIADKVFLGGWKNDDLVPKIKYGRSNVYGINYKSKDSKVFLTKDARFMRGYNRDSQPIFQPYLKTSFKLKEGYITNLYKYYGYSLQTGEAVYYLVNKKGVANRGHYLREDILDSTILNKKEGIPDNKVSEVLRTLYKEDPRAKYSFKKGIRPVTDTNIILFKEIDERAVEALEKPFELTEKATPIYKSANGSDIGGYSEKGRGTREGDGKDKAMRKIATVFIGEIVAPKDTSNLPLEKKYPGSTGTSALEIQKKQNSEASPELLYQGEADGTGRHTIFTPIENEKDLVVMLARNGERSGTPLNEATKEAIKQAHDEGAKFVVGDMPKVDTQFIEYLNELKADYTIYYGKVNRSADKVLIKTKQGKQVGISFKYTRTTPKGNEDTAYVFTENINSIGSDRKGSGSSVIRGLENAVGIVTKKRYVYYEDRDVNSDWNLPFKDTQEDFELFTSVNKEQFEKIDKYDKIVFPGAFANKDATLPTRFAEWLQTELKNRYGLVTVLNKTKTGLISTSVENTTKENTESKPTVPIEFEKENEDSTAKDACKPGGGIGKAALGLAPTLTAGGTWSIVKDLKGLPSHKSGGVQLSIKDGGVHFANGDSSIHAKGGLVLPNNLKY